MTEAPGQYRTQPYTLRDNWLTQVNLLNSCTQVAFSCLCCKMNGMKTVRNDFTVECLLVDSFVTKRTDEVKHLSAMLTSTTSLVNCDLNDIDEAQQLAGQELSTNLDQLLNYCSQTRVSLCCCYISAVFCAVTANDIF